MSLKDKKSGLNVLQDFGALIALIVLVVGISIFSPEFRQPTNLLSLLRQSSINGLIAFGMTGVILTGGIPVPVAMLAALVIGVIFGVVSGFLVTKGRLQPFIATLITMTVYRGVTMIYTEGKPISGLGSSAFLKFIGKGAVFGIPFPVIVLVVVFAIFYFVLNKTTFGRRIYATGSNAECAKLAGVNINKTKLIAYGVSGLMSAMAGLILLSRLSSAQPTLGSGYELDAIAAVALGGTSMNGGRGKITGTLFGVLIIAVLSNGMNILGISSYYQDVVKGIVILLAVLSDRKR